MAEPMSTVVPLALAGAGGGVAIAVGVDASAVVAAFAGAVMYSFFARGAGIPERIGVLLATWVFGYYAGLEMVRRELWGFSTPPLPSFVAAFFCVVVFKTVLAVFAEDGKKWIRKRLGITSGGQKDD